MDFEEMEKMLTTEFSGKKLGTPLMNAAGDLCKYVHHVKKLAQVPSLGAIMTGSHTLLPRDGNSGDTHTGNLNSRGLPGPGAGYLQEHLPEMAEIAHETGKLLFVSAAGFNPYEFAKLTEIALAGGADFVEENFGCPNVWNSGKQHRIISYDWNLLDQCLYEIAKLSPGRRICAKLSPISDPFEIPRYVEVLNRYTNILAAATIRNTIPNGFAFTADSYPPKPALSGEGFGGISGLIELTLGQIMLFRKYGLSETINMIAVGGIETGRHIYACIRGVRAIIAQIGNAFLGKENYDIFSKLMDEYMDELIKKKKALAAV